MGLALSQPDLISRLIVVDIAPVLHPLSRDYYGHIDVMNEIQARKLTKQKDAYDLIAKVEPDPVVQQFLLTNLKKNRSDGVYQFRIGLDNLGQSLGNLGEFVPLKPDAVYTKPTLFITGGESPFRKPFLEQPETIKALFPNSSIENVEGVGHWGKKKQNGFNRVYSRI
jgi:pimeloyl-ACP methyl ester carboxylesterase